MEAKHLEDAIELLKEAKQYMDDTHGYDSDLFEEINDFLEQMKNESFE